VNYSVVANTSAASRTGTLTIAEKTFTVTQAGISGETFAYVVNDSTVSVIDAATDSVSATVSLGSTFGGYGVAITPNGAKGYVTVRSTVFVLDTETNSVIDTILLGNNAFGVAITPDGTKAYVAQLNVVSVIETATNDVIATVPVGSNPREIAITPDGTKAYVTNFISGTVSVINTATNTLLTTVPVGSYPLGVAITPNGSKAYIANGGSNTISIISTITDTVTGTVNGWSSIPRRITTTPDGTKAYVTTDSPTSVRVINTSTDTMITTIPIGGAPQGVAITPDSTKAYVTTFSPDTVSIITTSDDTVINTVPGMVSPTGIAIWGPAPTPQQFTFGASGGTGSVNVTVPGGQSWTAVSSVPWIKITSGSSGTGNGIVKYSVAANTGSTARTGTLIIAGKTFTVQQNGSCLYSGTIIQVTTAPGNSPSTIYFRTSALSPVFFSSTTSDAKLINAALHALRRQTKVTVAGTAAVCPAATAGGNIGTMNFLIVNP
jgi:YVTN family beta-propeller protein